MTLESNQEFIQGAEVLAAGRTLGLSDDETISLKKQKMRENIDRRRAERAQREGNRAEAEAFLAEDSARFTNKGRNRRSDERIRGVRLEDPYPDPFGGQIQNVYDDDGFLIDTRDLVQDSQSYTAEEAERMGVNNIEIDEETGFRVRQPDDGLLQERGGYVTLNPGKPNEVRLWREGHKVAQAGEKGAASRADRPARARFFMKPENARSSRRPDFAKGGQRDITIAPNPKYADQAIAESKAMREGSKRAAKQDRVRFSPEMRRENDEAAYYQAQTIAKDFQLGGKYVRGDENLEEIVEVIQRLGPAGAVGHGDPGNYQAVRAVNANNFGIASPLMRDGQTIGYYGDVDGAMLELGEINSPDTSNALNAPETFTKGQEWAVANRPNLASPGGTTFGQPQVNVGNELGLFGERLRGMGLGMEAFPTPRSMGEFEAAIDSAIARKLASGETLFRFDPETKRNVVVQNPGIEDVLYGMRYTANEKAALANALIQTETALQRDVNLDRKSDFMAGRPQGLSEAPLFMGVEPEDAMTPLERIKNEKVGRGKDRKNVGPELRKLSEERIIEALEAKGQLYTIDENGEKRMLPEAARAIAEAAEGRKDAQKPFLAAPAGQPPERARFIRGKDRGKSREALQAQYGEEQGSIAAEIEARMLADQKRKAEGSGVDAFAAKQRALDARFEREGKQANIDFQDAEIGQLMKAMMYGREFDAPGTDTDKRGDLLRVPPRDQFVPFGFLNPRLNGQAAVAEDKTPKAPGSWMGGVAENAAVVNPWSRERQPVPVQPTRPSVVVPSMAPDPWAMRAEARMPQTEAGGGMGGGKPPRGPAALPYGFDYDGPEQRPERAPQQGPRNRTQPRNEQQRKERVENFKTRVGGQARDFATSPKYKRGRNIAYGATGSAAALGTVLGLSNMGNEEEERN